MILEHEIALKFHKNTRIILKEQPILQNSLFCLHYRYRIITFIKSVFLTFSIYLCLFWTEYSICPEFVTTDKRVYLVHGGQRFLKSKVYNDKTYWRCIASRNKKCRAKVTTKQVNGWEVARITHDCHSHPCPT